MDLLCCFYLVFFMLSRLIGAALWSPEGEGVISKGPKYRFPSNIDFHKCHREIAASLNDLSNRWCKRENAEPDALKEWKINIFKIIDTHISFYSCNTHLLSSKPKSSFRHLKRGIQDFHMNYVLVPADIVSNSVVLV